MQTAVQLTINSLQIGAVYILFALGLTLIFGVMRMVNFAHGQFFTLSALIVSVAVPWLVARGVSVPAAFLAAAALGVAGAVALGYILYQFGFRFFQRDLIGSFILSIGLVLLLEGVYLDIFGGAVRTIPPIIGGTVTILGGALTTQRLVLCVVAVAFTAVLYWVLATTKLGKALRAVAEDHEAAMLQGIPFRRIALSGFLIATLLAAVAGVLIAPVSVITPTAGADYLVKGFIAVIVGGLGSIPGAIVGSMLIALIESVGGYFLDPTRATIGMFVLVMVVLLVRPKGLLGHG